MTKRIDITLVFETAMLLMVGAMLAAATGYPEGVRLFPFWIGFPTLLLLIYLWANKVRSLAGRRGQGAAADKAFEDTDASAWKPILRTIAWVTAYYLLILLFGFFVSTPLWLTGFFIRRSRLSPGRAVLAAAVSSYAVIRSVMAFGIIIWPGAIPRVIAGILGGGVVPPL